VVFVACACFDLLEIRTSHASHGRDNAMKISAGAASRLRPFADREAGMIGRGFGQAMVQEFADRGRIAAPGGNGPLAGKVLADLSLAANILNRRFVN
jgi:hypothetical protein